MTTIVPLKLGFVNAFLIRGRTLALVDSGYPGMEGAILQAIRNAGEDPASLALIVATHGHADHYGSAAALRKITKAPIACGDLDAGEIELGENRHLDPVGRSGRFARFFFRFAGGRYRSSATAPDILFSGPASMERWGLDVSVVPVPGHTPGSIAVLPGASTAERWGELQKGGLGRLPWAIAGDLLSGRFLAPREVRLPLFAWDLRSMASSLRSLALAETVYVGHGGPLRGEALTALADRAEREAAIRDGGR